MQERAGVPQSAFVLSSLMRDVAAVPETKPIGQMLEEFQKQRVHMAMVVDEFGTVTGLVTVEDVLEQITGEIEDEYDGKPIAPSPTQSILHLDGATNIRDLDTQYGMDVPIDKGFETLAGFILFQLGHIPAAGEEVSYSGHRFIVVEMAGKRISRVRVERAEPEEGSDGDESLPAVP